jgi:hypothetical protein
MKQGKLRIGAASWQLDSAKLCYMFSGELRYPEELSASAPRETLAGEDSLLSQNLSHGVTDGVTSRVRR